jgi:hypothetical protein
METLTTPRRPTASRVDILLCSRGFSFAALSLPLQFFVPTCGKEAFMIRSTAVLIALLSICEVNLYAQETAQSNDSSPAFFGQETRCGQRVHGAVIINAVR